MPHNRWVFPASSLLITLLAFVVLADVVAGRAPTVTLGHPELVLSPSDTNRMGILGWPDSNLGALFLNGSYYIFASNAKRGATEGLTTTNLNNLRRNCRHLKVQALKKGGSKAFDRDYAGGGAIYFDPISQILIQLYHGEYWYGGGSVAWLPAYTSFGLAVSHDLGKSWKKLGEVISPNVPRSNRCAIDVGNGSLLLKPDGYLYVYYSDTTSACEDSTIAVARARLSDIIVAAQTGGRLRRPGQTFLKYYHGSFSQPGVIDISKPALGGGSFTPLFLSNDKNWPTMSSVAFDKALQKYVIVYVAGWDQNNESGIALRLSTDGIRWSDPTVLKLGKTAFYPALLNAGAGDPNILGSAFYI